MTVDEERRAKLLRRDRELAGFIERANVTGQTAGAEELMAWALERDADRRALAEEALERYRELNLLYRVTESAASLDPESIVELAATEVAGLCRRAATVALLVDADGRRLRPQPSAAAHAAAAGIPGDGFILGEGIVGSIAAAAAGGEIVNDVAADGRASPAEARIGALMAVPLVSGDRRLGVLLLAGPLGSEFTASEFRMLSAVAALTAPALDAALTHVRSVALAKAREAELEAQLEVLRDEVEANRREERISEITSSDYFQSLRREADVLRQALKSGGRQ